MAILAATVGATVAVPAPAHADRDPYFPILSAGYCAGGKVEWNNSPDGYSFCDGKHFPDGSYWHSIQYDFPNTPSMQCVINSGDRLRPRPAPPGSCNGAV
jgi:hypothetical protein